MARYFFIVGLPRSRTAWLSNLFTTGRVYCFHDASRRVERVPDLHEIVHESRVDADFIGTSDNGLTIMPAALDWYRERDPDVPVVVVRRPKDEVVRSLFALYDEGIPAASLAKMVNHAAAGLDMIAGAGNVLEVRYHDLDNINTLESMWRHLIPGVAFDMQRAAAVRQLNVQMAQPWYDNGFSEAFVRHVADVNGRLI